MRDGQRRSTKSQFVAARLLDASRYLASSQLAQVLRWLTSLWGKGALRGRDRVPSRQGSDVQWKVRGKGEASKQRVNFFGRAKDFWRKNSCAFTFYLRNRRNFTIIGTFKRMLERINDTRREVLRNTKDVSNHKSGKRKRHFMEQFVAGYRMPCSNLEGP